MSKQKTLQELTDEGISFYNDIMDQVHKDTKLKKPSSKPYAQFIDKWPGQGLFSNRTMKAMNVDIHELCDFFHSFGVYVQPVATTCIVDGKEEAKHIGVIIGKTENDLEMAARTVVDTAIEMGAKHNNTIN